VVVPGPFYNHPDRAGVFGSSTGAQSYVVVADLACGRAPVGLKVWCANLGTSDAEHPDWAGRPAVRHTISGGSSERRWRRFSYAIADLRRRVAATIRKIANLVWRKDAYRAWGDRLDTRLAIIAPHRAADRR
jgi:hypothetical protein